MDSYGISDDEARRGRTLLGLLRMAQSIIESMRYGKGGCFCEMSIGNPMYNKHPNSCAEAEQFLTAIKGLACDDYEQK